MTDERRAGIEKTMEMLENMKTQLIEWHDEERKEWVQDTKNPRRESDFSIVYRTRNFIRAVESIDRAMDYLQCTLRVPASGAAGNKWQKENENEQGQKKKE